MTQKNYFHKRLNCRQAIKLALQNLEKQTVETHWADAGIVNHPEWITSSDPKWAGGTLFEDKRSIVVEGTPEDLWNPIIKIGGDNGYYYGNWLWALRGLLDKLFGGVGLRRGRRNKSILGVGDVLDFFGGHTHPTLSPGTPVLVSEVRNKTRSLSSIDFTGLS